MATEPGNKDGNEPVGDNKPAGEAAPVGGPAAPAPAATPRPAEGASEKAPGQPAEPPAAQAPSRLVDTPPQRPAEKPATPRPAAPLLSARSADRLAAMKPPPRRRGGGCFTFLLVIAIIVGGGYTLWRAGKLDPLIAWSQPYTDMIRPIIAKIEALIPGQQAPASESDDAMILETKQLLLKLDFQTGPVNGTLDPATVAAIEAYQEAAGLPIDGQPSEALLDELRAVTNPPSN
jgi:hypothetical protein